LGEKPGGNWKKIRGPFFFRSWTPFFFFFPPRGKKKPNPFSAPKFHFFGKVELGPASFFFVPIPFFFFHWGGPISGENPGESRRGLFPGQKKKGDPGRGGGGGHGQTVYFFPQVKGPFGGPIFFFCERPPPPFSPLGHSGSGLKTGGTSGKKTGGDFFSGLGFSFPRRLVPCFFFLKKKTPGFGKKPGENFLGPPPPPTDLKKPQKFGGGGNPPSPGPGVGIFFFFPPRCFGGKFGGGKKPNPPIRETGEGRKIFPTPALGGLTPGSGDFFFSNRGEPGFPRGGGGIKKTKKPPPRGAPHPEPNFFFPGVSGFFCYPVSGAFAPTNFFF